MTASFDLGAVDRVTADAVGAPGSRTFFLQARAGDRLVTLAAEKEQIRALAVTVQRLVEALDEDDDDAAIDESALALEDPAVPEWRIGTMELSYDDDTGRIAVVIEEAVPEDREDDAASARFEATPSQMRALAAHAMQVVEAGRPRCQLCNFPIDPGGHACPALNGHRDMPG